MCACRRGVISWAFFLGLFILFCPDVKGHALETQGHENTAAKTRKERLVARAIGFSNIRWCGNDRLLLFSYEGLHLLDLATGKWTEVSAYGTKDHPLKCSPDGKWVLYVDKASIRMDSGRVLSPDDDRKGVVEWQGVVADLYRYEVSTGKVERFAVRRDRPESVDVISPDGKKALLGGRHNTPFEMPEPKWEVRWLDNKWAHLDPIWLADSSGIVTMVHDERNNKSLGVEIFGENGWSRVFIPGRDFDVKGRLVNVVAVKNKTISLSTAESYSGLEMGRFRGRIKYYYYICDIEQSGLNCKEILEFDLKFTNIRYAVLPGGDIIYKDVEDHCIRRFSRNLAETECIVDGPDVGRFHGLSPDGNRIVYERYWEKFNADTSYDLYVMEID